MHASMYSSLHPYSPTSCMHRCTPHSPTFRINTSQPMFPRIRLQCITKIHHNRIRIFVACNVIRMRGNIGWEVLIRNVGLSTSPGGARGALPLGDSSPDTRLHASTSPSPHTPACIERDFSPDAPACIESISCMHASNNPCYQHSSLHRLPSSLNPRTTAYPSLTPSTSLLHESQDHRLPLKKRGPRFFKKKSREGDLSQGRVSGGTGNVKKFFQTLLYLSWLEVCPLLDLASFGDQALLGTWNSPRIKSPEHPRHVRENQHPICFSLAAASDDWLPAGVFTLVHGNAAHYTDTSVESSCSPSEARPRKHCSHPPLVTRSTRN